MQHHVRNIISDYRFLVMVSYKVLSRYVYSNLKLLTQTNKSEVCGRVLITDSLTESLTDFLTDFRIVRESEKRPRTCVGQMLIPALACQELVLTRTRDA